MRFVVFLVGLVITLATRDADACLCALPGLDVPVSGSAGVPTNVRVWVSANQGEGTLRLIDAQDNVVPSETGHVDLGGFPQKQRWLKPVGLLQPRSEYSVHVAVEEFAGASTHLVSAFTTGDGPDDSAPALPAEASRRASVYEDGPLTGCSSCGVSVSFEPDPARAFVVAKLAAEATGEPASLSAVSYAGSPTHESTVFLGSGPCNSSWPGAKRGASSPVVFGAYDLAGNFSGWTDGTIVVIDDDGYEGGCTSGEASLFGGLLLASRRRSRRLHG